jgi:hypothetical protein
MLSPYFVFWFGIASVVGCVVAWFMLSIAVGIAANKRCNRWGFDWFVFSLLFSPLVGAAMLYALGYNNRVRDITGRRIVFLVAGFALLILWAISSINHAHAQQQTFRDSSGRTIGTATTDSQGTRTFRDDRGRTTGTATRDSGGTTTFRDSQGRTTGTVSGGRH